MDITNKNTGVLATEPQAGDFVAGFSPIVFEARNTTADWRSFVSGYQRQSDSLFDTNGCVSYSLVGGCIAPQINWMIVNNLLPQRTMDWLNSKGYLVNNKIELSERFIVIMSGTTDRGNTGQRVAQAVRQYGVPSSKTWPNLLDGPRESNDNLLIPRNQYFVDPSPEAKAEALEFLNYFKFSWEFITNLSLVPKYLQESPIQDYTPVCTGWGFDTPVKACSGPIQHATAIMAKDGAKYVIEDQYPPFIKELASNYPIPTMLRFVVYPTPQTPVVNSVLSDGFVFNRDLVIGERSQDVLHLQYRLGIPQSAIYDQTTADTVFKFQLRNLSSTFLEMVLNLKGRRVGPRTRAVLNK